MNGKMLVSCALAAALFSTCFGTAFARGFGGAGGFRGGMGGFQRGGFDMHSDMPMTHSSTGPAGTNRSTTMNPGGTFSHSSSTSNAYGQRSGTTTGNVNTGNYTHTGSGSNANGSYSTAGAGNAYNRTYNGTSTATNKWGQTYYGHTYANNGVVYHGAVVGNPVYAGYPAWGWNGGTAWYAAPYYWGGGFWGPFAIGATTAALYGSYVWNDTTYTSYEVQESSAGSKLLESYGLTQTPCGPSGLVVIFGPNNSVICAKPNGKVAAGNYSVNVQTLALVSEKS